MNSPLYYGHKEQYFYARNLQLILWFCSCLSIKVFESEKDY